MRQQEKRQYKERTGNYVDGNTVRRIQAEPKRRGDEVHEELLRKREEERKERLRKRNSRKAARKNQERALQMNPGYILFLTAALAVMVAVVGCYLYLQSELSGRRRHVTALESEVMELKNKNDVIQKEINTSVNLDTIRKKAMEDLGMVYPSKDQIEYFEVDTNDYMNQYEEIPER